MSQRLARLMKLELLDLHRVAQDGTRVRASAGAASFRSGETSSGSCSPLAPTSRTRHRPKILLGLWGYATSDGVGSGREVARLVELHAAYRWLCGGVAVAYHRLNDFRSDHGDVFSEVVTQLLARLMKHDLIDLHRVAQDGTRIRASAGAASFRSGETLERLMTEARAHLVEVTRVATKRALTGRHAATMGRVAQDRLARLEHALAAIPTSPRARRVVPRTRPRACPPPIPTPAS